MERPEGLLYFIFKKSSTAPKIPKLPAINIKNQIKGFDKSPHNRTPHKNAPYMVVI